MWSGGAGTKGSATEREKSRWKGVHLTVDGGLAHPTPGTYPEDAWQVLGLGVDNIRVHDWAG